MEINRFEDVLGVVPTADVVEGRFVVLTSNPFSYDFGSRADLPGAKVPATAEEGKRAKFCITFAVDNRPTPIMEPMPAYDFALRGGGFDQAANAPFSATVYLTHPGNQEGLTIPSGQPAIAYTEATVTLPSGAYVYSSDIIVPGCAIRIGDTASDTAASAGKPIAQTTLALGYIGFTERYDSTTGRLTIRIE
jgi:hypothetical protein